jgi:hypothetical protein
MSKDPWKAVRMTLPWEKDDGIPTFLRRDANNRAPFMDAVTSKPQTPTCTEPLPMPWSALPTTENADHEQTTCGPFNLPDA